MLCYGYVSGIAIDPIEKKPLFHFYPGSDVLSFGTLGCNLGCSFCQNWHISKSKEDASMLQSVSPQELVLIAKQRDCKGVAFTYNDPVIFFEYAIDTAVLCREEGLKTVAVTAGYINEEPRAEFFKHMDAVNIDLKSFNEKFYRKLCLAELAPVLETLKYVKNETDCHLEITTLLIEGENTSDKEIIHQCDWIVENLGVDVPLHFSAFFPAWHMKNTRPTNPKTLLRACEIAKRAGIRHVYTGNVPACDEYATTYCHNCKNPLIVRHGYHIEEYNLKPKGVCKFCSTVCPGVFD